MALKKAPKNAEEFSKSSKFFWVFKCDKKTCESYTPSSKSSSPRMVGQEDYLKILSGKSLQYPSHPTTWERKRLI